MISTAWTKDLSQEEKETFIELLRNNHNNSILLKLKKIIMEKRISLEASERNPDIYDNANWAFMQAHNNGARQMLKLVEDLLSFTDKEKV